MNQSHCYIDKIYIVVFVVVLILLTVSIVFYYAHAMKMMLGHIVFSLSLRILVSLLYLCVCIW